MSRRSIFPRFNPLFAAVAMFAAALAGCGPKYTYPAAKVAESVEDLCQKEYGIAAKARVIGKTVGAVLYIDDILDDKGQIPKEVHEQMGKVMQAVTRVALSTDLDLEFCTVIVRDRQLFNELVITRSLDDTKRANADAIGIEESMNRTLFGQGRYNPAEAETGSFILKDVKKEEFLAEQIAQRIRFSFVKDSKDESGQPFLLVDGVFEAANGRRTFRFSVLALKSEDPKRTLIDILKIVGDVLGGYRYTTFQFIEIQDYLNRRKLALDQPTFLRYLNKEISDEEVLKLSLTESQSIQEAFRLFGFNLPKDAAEEKALTPTP